MAAIDVVNRVYRNFFRYTGDGLPGEPVNAPLPIGDPQSGVHNPKKSEMRAALLAPLSELEGVTDEASAAAAAAVAAASLAAEKADAAAASAASIRPVIAGGTTGQALIKASNANYDLAWGSSGDMLKGIYDPSGINGNAFNGFPIGTIAAIKALSIVHFNTAYLLDRDKGGMFVLRAGAIPYSDPLEGVYLLSNTAGYYWERQSHGNTFNIKWFGAKMDGGTNDGPAIQAAINLAGLIAGASGGAHACVFAPHGATIRLDQQVNLTVPIKVDFRSYVVTSLTTGFLFAINPTAIGAAGSSGFDLYFEGLVGPGGGFPASRNGSGLTAFIIRAMIFSTMTVRYLSGFTRDGIFCDGTGLTFTGGQQQSILHNTFNLGVVANCGYGFFSLSLHAATHQFQGNRVNVQNCLQNFMGIVDGDATYKAGTSNTYDLNALDNATSVGIDCYCPFNTFYVGFTGAPGTSLRMNGNDCDYNDFVFSNNLTTDIVINNNGGGIHNTVRCKSPSNLPSSQAVVSGTDYTNNYGCPISVTVPMTGTGTYQMIITNPQGGAYAISAVASGGLATFPTLHHGWKWKVFTASGSVSYGGALILAA